MTVEEYIWVEASDALKTAKLQAMRELLASKQADNQLLTWTEVEQLSQQERLRQPIFDQLIYPVLAREIAGGSVAAIKLLLHLIQYQYRAQNTAIRTTYDVGTLVELGLQLVPGDKELLQRRYQGQRRYYEHTIHEVPWGVLWDMNGASADQCDELLESLTAFQDLSQQLALDESALIAQCRYYYRSYADYLRNRAAYPDFAAYLAIHPA